MGACGTDSDYKQVDFTPKENTARPEVQTTGREPLHVAVAAMVSPRETFIYYQELIDYLGARLQHDIVLVQRRTYGEISELLAKGQIDFAFICTGPFVSGSQALGFEAVATPIVRGQPYYQAYLIVHKESPWLSLADLQDRTFAFTDPDSNTGTLVPRYWLKQIDQRPETFFSSFTYTYSHDNSILAVAKKLVDGAAVDGHIWEYYQRRNDFYSSNTRVIRKSEPFGSPPLVVSKVLDPGVKSDLVQIVLTMHEDAKGLTILSELMIDRFAAPEEAWYLPVKQLLQ